jgi:hypothetical protein
MTIVVPFSTRIVPVVGQKYNWKGQLEKLVFMGTKRYFNDLRTWYQFALVEKPNQVWSEVLASDLENFEETK